MTNDRTESGVCQHDLLKPSHTIDVLGPFDARCKVCFAYFSTDSAKRRNCTGQQPATDERGSGKAAERLRALQQAYGCIPRIGAELNRDVAEVLAELAAARKRIRELESLNAERNRQNAAAFEERDELQRQIERYAWLVKHGESYFGSLWREATGADIDVGMAAGRDPS